jgi:hypothetical protein
VKTHRRIRIFRSRFYPHHRLAFPETCFRFQQDRIHSRRPLFQASGYGFFPRPPCAASVPRRGAGFRDKRGAKWGTYDPHALSHGFGERQALCVLLPGRPLLSASSASIHSVDKKARTAPAARAIHSRMGSLSLSAERALRRSTRSLRASRTSKAIPSRTWERASSTPSSAPRAPSRPRGDRASCPGGRSIPCRPF